MTTIESVETDPTDKLYGTIKEKIESLSKVKFAAYRVACKLRVLQKYLKLTYVDYNVLVRVFNIHQFQFGIEVQRISLDTARKVLLAIYQSISSYHFNELSIDETVETLLTFLREILNVNFGEGFDLNSFKIILFTLSNARLPEKYRCFFRQITSPNVIASQAKLTELFAILLKLPNHFDDVDSFQAHNIPACVQSCLDHTHDGIIREDIFVNWMTREPQTLVWLPTLHRLVATETVRHEAQCNVCKTYPVIGMRYRCLRCFNFDLCQTCFFTGDHGQKHDGTHPIEEYCKQVTPFEDLKAFVEFVKLKVGKHELKRKERYLTIERSKSFSDVQNRNPNEPVTVERHTLKRETHSLKKSQTQEVNLLETKTEENTLSYHEKPNGLQTEPSTDLNDGKIKEKTTESSTNNEETQQKKLNYITIEKKKMPPPPKAHISDDEEDVPILMPKQHKPIKKSSIHKEQTEELVHAEHYKLPPKDTVNDDEDDDDYRPPLPPKQRHQNNLSRALVYDFIGSELQELRATLAQFDSNTSTV